MSTAGINRTGSLFFIYGSPGSGKSTLGARLAELLALPFFDLDEQIVAKSGQSIPEIFSTSGEAAFRAMEADCLANLVQAERGVISLGGGTLLDPQCRELADRHGKILCLEAARAVLLQRTQQQAGVRPLLAGGEAAGRLATLLARREEHYASFPQRLDTTNLTPGQAAEQALLLLGAFHIRGMGAGYDVRVASGGLDMLGNMMRARGLSGPVALVSDNLVGRLYAARAAAVMEKSGYKTCILQFAAGEEHKTLQTVSNLCEEFLAAGMERGSTVVALGGGVVTDLAGFAAAVYLRGVRWAAVPTSLLGMVDASLGGKTGVDLPQGKNLAGAFHAPAFVLADTETLATLPDAELRSGLAEVVKAGLIADPGLFALCARGWDEMCSGDPGTMWGELVARAAAVKARFVEADPYEQGRRAALNLGHTVGHALERATDYGLRHGEAVSIGMVIEAKIAEQLGMAEPGLADQIAAVCAGLGLPVSVPTGLTREEWIPWMQADKKKAGGAVRFALPVRIGEVRTGIAVDLEKINLEERT